MKTTPKQIALAAVNGLRRQLNLSESQVKAGFARYPKPPAWKQFPNMLVIPGADQPDGAGDGAQDGGDLLRRIHLTVVVYDQSLRDMVNESEVALLKDDGIMDWTERVLSVFRYSFEGGNPYSFLGGLLIEPLFYMGTSEASWEDIELSICRREISFSSLFETQLTNVSLITPQTR